MQVLDEGDIHRNRVHGLTFYRTCGKYRSCKYEEGDNLDQDKKLGNFFGAEGVPKVLFGGNSDKTVLRKVNYYIQSAQKPPIFNEPLFHNKGTMAINFVLH